MPTTLQQLSPAEFTCEIPMTRGNPEYKYIAGHGQPEHSPRNIGERLQWLSETIVRASVVSFHNGNVDEADSRLQNARHHIVSSRAMRANIFDLPTSNVLHDPPESEAERLCYIMYVGETIGTFGQALQKIIDHPGTVHTEWSTPLLAAHEFALTTYGQTRSQLNSIPPPSRPHPMRLVSYASSLVDGNDAAYGLSLTFQTSPGLPLPHRRVNFAYNTDHDKGQQLARIHFNGSRIDSETLFDQDGPANQPNSIRIPRLTEALGRQITGILHEYTLLPAASPDTGPSA